MWLWVGALDVLILLRRALILLVVRSVLFGQQLFVDYPFIDQFLNHSQLHRKDLLLKVSRFPKCNHVSRKTVGRMLFAILVLSSDFWLRVQGFCQLLALIEMSAGVEEVGWLSIPMARNTNWGDVLGVLPLEESHYETRPYSLPV